MIDPITADHFVYLFNCKQIGRGSDSMMGPTQNYSFRWSCPELFMSVSGRIVVQPVAFFCSSITEVLLDFLDTGIWCLKKLFFLSPLCFIYLRFICCP